MAVPRIIYETENGEEITALREEARKLRDEAAKLREVRGMDAGAREGGRWPGLVGFILDSSLR